MIEKLNVVYLGMSLFMLVLSFSIMEGKGSQIVKFCLAIAVCLGLLLLYHKYITTVT